MAISDALRKSLLNFLDENKKVDLLTAYAFFLQERDGAEPVLFPSGKTIYQNADEAVRLLEKEGKLWREAQVQIHFSRESVNAETKKIYLCPFCSKVYGDNLHPNPQDAIYDHVARCPQNKERLGGLPIKRFNVSEDPEMIKHYITERKEPISKTVYSSVITGKLFNSKSAVVRDFTHNHLKSITILEALGQNRFEIETHFLSSLQKQMNDEKISAFVEELSKYEEFEPYVERWVES
ncbi:MAG: DUF2709 domain-containing protein [Verrucomicrobia bacterium]|nr:DUF2709 domain-containing protein [Verrucomicrobiota bacterium]